MEKIKQLLETLAYGDERADRMLAETDMLDEREFADYVYQHADEMKDVLGVKYLAEKDANPELAKTFYKLLQRGEAMRNPDPYSRKDVYGDDLKDIDYYLEQLGVPKEGGVYTDEIRSRYTNPDNKEYVDKAETALINTLANSEGIDPREWKQNMLRAAYDYQRNKQARGYDANGEVRAVAWTADALESVLLPRIREARLMGKDWELKDLGGDLVELGLSFIPGIGMVSKNGKVIADMGRLRKIANKAGAYAFDWGTVPVGAQLYDMAAYGDDDPRGQWSTARVLGQGAAGAGGVGIMKAGGVGIGSKMAGATGGDMAEKGVKQGFGQFVKDIYYKTDDAIANRQAQLDALAKGARKRENVVLPGQHDITSGPFSTDDMINAENYRILTEEAKRLKDSAPARREWRSAMSKADVAQEAEAALKTYNQKKATLESFLEDAKAKGDKQKIDKYTMDLKKLGEPPVLRPSGLAEGELQGAYDAYASVNHPSYEISMLPDGRFIKTENIKNGKIMFPDAEYSLPLPNGTKDAVVMSGPGMNKSVVDRNQVVQDAIKSGKYPELKRQYEGMYNTPFKETMRDFTVNALSNAGAREGVVRNVMGFADDAKQKLDEKRMMAAWNRDMNRLRTEIMDKAVSPEQRREYFDAIMNARVFGLDELPEEVYKKNPKLYKWIAKVLGNKEWKHPSESKMPDYPTTSYSSAIDYIVSD